MQQGWDEGGEGNLSHQFKGTRIEFPAKPAGRGDLQEDTLVLQGSGEGKGA